MLLNRVRLLASVGLAALIFFALPSRALAQGYLGANVRPFAVLAGTEVTCTGASTITGDVGVSPGSLISGFPVPCTDVGTLRIPPAADPAKLDLTAAYTYLAGLPCASTVGPDLAGLTLTQGVYCVGAAASNLTGTLILDAQGNPNPFFVFKMSSTLITSPGSTVTVINGTLAQACGAQWQVSSSATLDVGTTFLGNILALTMIGMNNGATLTGRALARNAAVTLDNNLVSFAACTATGGGGGGPVPTLPQIAAWILLVVLLVIGAYFVSRRGQFTSGH
jgi:hypothetical protein